MFKMTFLVNSFGASSRGLNRYLPLAEQLVVSRFSNEHRISDHRRRTKLYVEKYIQGYCRVFSKDTSSLVPVYVEK